MNIVNKIRNVYLYVRKDKLIDCIKYGMKLSEYTNVSFYKGTLIKKGILAYISPKDSDKYFNESYDILRIKTDELNIYVNNSSIVEYCENNTCNFSEMCNLNNYLLGEFINPKLIICSTILPEYIYKYNRIIDVPLLVDNSKEFYLSKELEKENENKFDNLTFSMLKSLS
ncbi:MAG: hypothetical protein PHD15_00350 [Clostridia bacterium]|nr:hypothetical protein [Clostridia bacterium]MDD4386202.1 hypothetical protein [Clostridia bacterium]